MHEAVMFGSRLAVAAIMQAQVEWRIWRQWWRTMVLLAAFVLLRFPR